MLYHCFLRLLKGMLVDISFQLSILLNICIGRNCWRHFINSSPCLKIPKLPVQSNLGKSTRKCHSRLYTGVKITNQGMLMCTSTTEPPSFFINTVCQEYTCVKNFSDSCGLKYVDREEKIQLTLMLALLNFTQKC